MLWLPMYWSERTSWKSFSVSSFERPMMLSMSPSCETKYIFIYFLNTAYLWLSTKNKVANQELKLIKLTTLSTKVRVNGCSISKPPATLNTTPSSICKTQTNKKSLILLFALDFDWKIMYLFLTSFSIVSSGISWK